MDCKYYSILDQEAQCRQSTSCAPRAHCISVSWVYTLYKMLWAICEIRNDFQVFTILFQCSRSAFLSGIFITIIRGIYCQMCQHRSEHRTFTYKVCSICSFILKNLKNVESVHIGSYPNISSNNREFHPMSTNPVVPA